MWVEVAGPGKARTNSTCQLADLGNGSVEGGHLKVAGGEGQSRARCGWRWREVITPVCAAGG